MDRQANTLTRMRRNWQDLNRADSLAGDVPKAATATTRGTVKRGAAVTPLAETADLAAVILKVNELIASLQAAGVIG